MIALLAGFHSKSIYETSLRVSSTDTLFGSTSWFYYRSGSRMAAGELRHLSLSGLQSRPPIFKSRSYGRAYSN